MKLESGGGNRDHIYNTTAETVSVFHLRSDTICENSFSG